MSARRSPSPASATLEIPRKSVELEDPGARDLESSEGEDDHFSDASEGRPHIKIPSSRNSPVPTTRVEKVDDSPRYGEVPGTPAYQMRMGDAVPDEIEVVPEGIRSHRSSRSTSDRPVTPGGTPIPRMVVEKVDPSTPSHGDVPGTEAYEQRKADATPDVVVAAPEPGKRAPLKFEPDSVLPNRPIPETIVSRADTDPPNDDGQRSPTSLHRSTHRSHVRRKESVNVPNSGVSGASEGDDGFGDDFDDFEAGAGNDDFGEFDDGFQEPAQMDHSLSTEPTPLHSPIPSFPLLDFDGISTLSDLLGESQSHLGALFPSTADLSSRAPPPPIEDAQAIFTTDRSLSLWSQLVAPPPLQPPNWIKSRIRRLFLVSLGVPVDLDEILPASKQKKLILPSINLDGTTRSSSDGTKTAAIGSVARLKQAENPNASSTGSLDSSASGRHRRRRGPPPPPELDMLAVRRACTTTDEALDGLADDELRRHIRNLEQMTEKASEVLEYWLKMRDGKEDDKEAFEGVIENLVRHARRVRK